MSRESTESEIRRMMGDDPIESEDSPTISGSVGGSNSLDLSLRAIERLRAEFRGDNDSTSIPAKIIVEVVEETTGRLVVHTSSSGPQGIQMKDCPSIIRPDQMKAIRKAYNIPDDAEGLGNEVDVVL